MCAWEKKHSCRDGWMVQILVVSWFTMMVAVAVITVDDVCDYKTYDKIPIPKTINWRNSISLLHEMVNRSSSLPSWEELYTTQLLEQGGHPTRRCDDVVDHHTNDSSCFYMLNDQVLLKTVAEQIVTKLKWPNVVVLFDKHTESAASNLSQREATSLKVLMYEIYPDVENTTLDNILVSSYNVLPAAQRNFLVLCRSECIWRIIQQVNSYDEKTVAIRSLSKWIFAVPSHEIKRFEVKVIKLDHVAIFTYPDALSGQLNLIIHKNHTCVFGKISTLLYKKDGRSVSTVGSFDIFGQISLKLDVFPNTRFGFNKRKLLAATILWSPFVEERKDINGSSVYEGICMDLLYQMALSLNFSYDVIQTPDGEFGGIVNNSWTGLVGLLQRKDVDVVVAPLTVTMEREVVMDFIYPFYHDYGKGIFRRPDPTKSKWKTLLRPFKWDVFVCLAGVFLGSVVFLFVTKKIIVHLQTGNKYSNGCILQDSMWYTFGTFIKHHARYEHVSGTSKVFVSFLWFFSTIIIAAYSGNLVAFLTVKKTSPPFKTLAEITRQNTYHWGTVGGSMWVTLFKRSNVSVYRDVWNGIYGYSSSDEDVLSISADVHKTKVEDGQYIFFFDGDIITLWSEANCDLVILEETFYQIKYAVGLPNMSPYNKLFSDTMLAIEQSGLLDIWKKRWWPKANVCFGDQEVEARVIEVVDMQSAFYIVCIGLFIGIGLLLFEKWQR